MEAKDKVFLSRVDTVSENYQKRIDTLESNIIEIEYAIHLGEDIGGINGLIDGLDKLDRFHALQAEYKHHQQRVSELREQQRKTAALNTLCADANRLAGTDGSNFFTKAGNIYKEKTTDE